MEELDEVDYSGFFDDYFWLFDYYKNYPPKSDLPLLLW